MWKKEKKINAQILNLKKDNIEGKASMSQLAFNKKHKRQKIVYDNKNKVEKLRNGPTPHNTNIISHCETPSTSQGRSPLV